MSDPSPLDAPPTHDPYAGLAEDPDGYVDGRGITTGAIWTAPIGEPCPHHRAVLDGVTATLPHLDPDTRARIRRDLTAQCCDHPRPSRDNPTT